MLDHSVSNVPGSQLEEIVNWYLAALAPLNYTKQFDYPGEGCGLGTSPEEAPFWIGVGEGSGPRGFHVAFKAKSHDDVDKFYEEVVKADGRNDGKSGPRPMYGSNYYGAFVLDPLG